MRMSGSLWNPYVGGVLLGFVLLATFVSMGWGLGAAGANWRAGVAVVDAVAPEHVAATPTLQAAKAHGNALDDWIVFEVVGIVLGAAVAASTSGRMRREVLKGPHFRSLPRLGLALAGGAVVGAAARLARGCTSGQALSGGAMMSLGSWVFMLALFAGAMAAAPLVRRQWR